MFGCHINLFTEPQLGQLKPESGDQNKTEYDQHSDLQARLDWVHAFAYGNMMLGSEKHKRY